MGTTGTCNSITPPRPAVPARGQRLPVIDPSYGEPFDELQRGNAVDIDTAVQAARHCRDTGLGARMPALERGRPADPPVAASLAHADELALLEQRDCGKPTGRPAPTRSPWRRYFEFYAGARDKLHGETLPTWTATARSPGASRTASRAT